MSAVVQMTYQPADPRLTHVELLDFDELRRLNCGVTQRCDFLVLAFVTGGAGVVEVDFDPFPVAAGSVVWVGPGAVHRWVDFERIEGTLLLCQPASPLTSATRAAVSAPRATAVFSLSHDEKPYVRAALEHLALEVRPEVPVVPADLHAALLTALLVRIPSDPQQGPPDGTYEEFRRCIESDFRRHRDVAHYARRLSYSERTLTRSSVAATGCTAKRVIEERVVLEAKRLLTHHRLSAASCAIELGFSDPSAFSTFFTRVAGMRPGAWQALQNRL